MLRFDRRLHGGMKVFVLGAVVAIVAASVASSHTASAAVTTCSGLGTVSGATDITYGTCATDQNDGDGSVAFSTDGRSMTLATKTRQGTEQVAGFWQSSRPTAVTATRICLAINVTALKLKRDSALEEQLNLSYNGAQKDPLTWPVTTTGIQPAYCASVPAGATNVFWQLVSLAGGSKARVSQTLVTVGYSD
jgi:hypothetical protein